MRYSEIKKKPKKKKKKRNPMCMYINVITSRSRLMLGELDDNESLVATTGFANWKNSSLETNWNEIQYIVFMAFPQCSFKFLCTWKYFNWQHVTQCDCLNGSFYHIVTLLCQIECYYKREKVKKEIIQLDRDKCSSWKRRKNVRNCHRQIDKTCFVQACHVWNLLKIVLVQWKLYQLDKYSIKTFE